MPSILITGCSSGFGLETARLFLARGWHVVATMRSPRADLFAPSDRLRVVALDVTDPASIAAAIAAAGPIDVVVNNAGLGQLNALEGVSLGAIREIFETNTFGTMAVTRAVLPQFRARGAGVVVNVTSTVTLKPLPLLSVYTASKAAVNAFTESLALELEPFGIRARLVLPGRAPATRFSDNARARTVDAIPEAYGPLAQQVFSAWQQDEGPVTAAEDVAEAVFRAATDPSCPMQLPAGADAVIWAAEAAA
ncbi:SDR family NAD(P)-dependent oxidoreductase [Roseomonas sp. 18066]|uniref:SDR family NAD(P)-dependent oxidoreductase n=1 Tax=Roseomonas sp. 18066 TaxID=2681412 RepID=UPI00135BB8F6|nr:SDR family NAD(P)-dependent oxidoreductase [Roseomonas sp. 18066]